MSKTFKLISKGLAKFVRSLSMPMLLWIFSLALAAAGSTWAETPKARLLLTFDDGPSTRTPDSPTEQILDVLADNVVQDGIKAIFFVQTRLDDPNSGELTQSLLQRESNEGHVLAIHSGTLEQHSDHRGLDDSELDTFLVNTKTILREITGLAAQLVRPPYWAFDDRTLSAYTASDLHMLLTDVSVSDGKSWGYRANPRRRNVLKKQMLRVHTRIEAGEIPVLDGLLPIIITFHDTNTWTAAHMREYLSLLVSSAREAGIALDEQPFYASREQLEQAAVQRSMQERNPISLVPTRWRRYEAICFWPFCMS